MGEGYSSKGMGKTDIVYSGNGPLRFEPLPENWFKRIFGKYSWKGNGNRKGRGNRTFRISKKNLRELMIEEQRKYTDETQTGGHII